MHSLMLQSTVSLSVFNDYCDSNVETACKYLIKQDFDNSNPKVDLFAFAFICLTRYEEYVSINDRDEHQRFNSRSSFLSNEEVLQHPIVDYILLWFIAYVQSKLNIELTIISHKPRDLTFDIDHCWKYKYKKTWKSILGGVKDLCKFQLRAFKERIQVLSGKIPDPYALELWIANYNIKNATFFFLLASRNAFDKGHSPDNPALTEIIQDISASSEVGIHPGYYTASNKDQMAHQIDSFQSIMRRRPKISRQHYLRFELPTTYQNLLHLGIRKEYSMGYADNIGFRAGTSRPFIWFDLSQNTSTNLQILPFALMDMTLYKYLELSGEQALHAAELLCSRCNSVNGTFRVIWHNSSPVWQEPWLAYKEMFEKNIVPV